MKITHNKVGQNLNTKDSAKTDILITEKKEKSLPTPANPFKTPTNIKLFDKKCLFRMLYDKIVKIISFLVLQYTILHFCLVVLLR